MRPGLRIIHTSTAVQAPGMNATVEDLFYSPFIFQISSILSSLFPFPMRVRYLVPLASHPPHDDFSLI